MKKTTERLIAVNELGQRIGEDHPNSRYSNGTVQMVLRLHDEGFGYKRISRAMQMPRRTVRDICNGRIRCQYPDKFKRVRVPVDGEG